MSMKILTLILFAAVPSSLSAAAGQSPPPQQTAAAAARTSPVGVGDVAPDFTLEDQDGRSVTLSRSRGKAPVVLVFYRGYW
jgi:cytochrome oxidase Cu insertion factor (SCO1/SenC/PrrC family)